MLLPSIFHNNFVDDFFDDDFDDMLAFPSFGMFPAAGWMNTNIKDLGNEYQLEIELPGFDKKDISAHLDKGYLIITATRQEDKKDKKGRYIRRERYSGSCKRSFYVGEKLKEEDFKASFENGVLTISFPKDKTENRIEYRKYIPIN